MTLLFMKCVFVWFYQGEEKKKKKRGGVGPKKKEVGETRVIIARVQRQKKKFVTAVAGLETVPDLKIKDAARVFGKKFSSGSSVSESNTGAKEVVIQGDVSFDLPNLLVSEFKVRLE
jgi:density-regulated protein DRP1